jgi:GPH family glycoside/pentoside/hexuronide:cation symporter
MAEPVAAKSASPTASEAPETGGAAVELHGWRAITTYSLPAVGVNFMDSLVTFYLLKFATDVLLVAPGLMGLFFGVGRVWGAISDPVVGYWSDRTRTRLGRRRPWLLASALPLAGTFLALWCPPGLPPAALAAWMGVGILLFFTAQTTFEIPHVSLGAELGSGPHDRTRVFAGRLVLSLVGIFAGAGALGLLERAQDPRQQAIPIALLGAVATAGLVLFATGRLHERPEYQGRGATSSLSAFGDVLRNGHARILVAVLFLESLGFAAMTASMPFANQYVYDLSGMTSVFLASSLVVMVATVPLWPPLSRRYGKKQLWLFSLVARALAFGGLLFVGPGQWPPMIACVVVIGSMFGCGGVLAPSVQADVIDGDEVATGQRKEGTYFASWNIATKGAAGAAVLLSGLSLQLVGFEPNAEQDAAALLGIRALFAGLPCLFYALAAALLARLALYDGVKAAGGAA